MNQLKEQISSSNTFRIIVQSSLKQIFSPPFVTPSSTWQAISFQTRVAEMQAAVGACQMSFICRFGNSYLINSFLFKTVLACGNEADSQTEAGNARQTQAENWGTENKRNCRFTSPLFAILFFFYSHTLCTCVQNCTHKQSSTWHEPIMVVFGEVVCVDAATMKQLYLLMS